MKPHKIIKTISMVLCLSLMCASFSGCNWNRMIITPADMALITLWQTVMEESMI